MRVFLTIGHGAFGTKAYLSMASMVWLGSISGLAFVLRGSIEYGSGSPGIWVKSKADRFGWVYWHVWRVHIHRSPTYSESRCRMHN